MTTLNIPPPRIDRSPPVRYAIAIAIFFVALATRFTMSIDGNLPFVTFYPATVLVFYLCGSGPGLLMAALCASVGYSIFSTPNWTWVSDWRGIVALSSYLSFAALVNWLVLKLEATFNELRVTLTKLRETSNDMQDLYDHAPCGYYSLDANGKYIQANDVALELIGCRRDEVIGLLGPTDFYTDEGREFFANHFARFKAEGSIGPAEFDLVGKGGKTRRVVLTATAIKDRDGNFVKTRSVMYDISELHKARQDLEDLTRQQQSMLDNELVGIVKVRDRRAVWKNRALESMYGYEPGELDGHAARLLYLDDETYESIGQAAYPILARGETYRTQLQMKRKDGKPMWVDMSGTVLNQATGESLWLMLDITRMKQHQAHVEMMAFHDPLTGLPNRLLLSNLLRQAILSAERSGALLAVCFLDLNGFKSVNDRYGHDTGDRLLQVMAARLREAIRSCDVVARFGGDEFVLLLSDLASREQYQEIVDRVQAIMSQPVFLGGNRTAAVSASIGTAFYRHDGTDPETLLQHADQAMYKIKHAARQQVKLKAS